MRKEAGGFGERQTKGKQTHCLAGKTARCSTVSAHHCIFIFMFYSHNSTSFYINNSDVPCNTGAQPLPGELCAWLNSWRPNVGPVFLGGGGYRSWVPPRGITVPSSSEGPTHHCYIWHAKEHQHDLEAGSHANPGEATFYCQTKMHPRWFGYCFFFGYCLTVPNLYWSMVLLSKDRIISS